MASYVVLQMQHVGHRVGFINGKKSSCLFVVQLLVHRLQFQGTH